MIFPQQNTTIIFCSVASATGKSFTPCLYVKTPLHATIEILFG